MTPAPGVKWYVLHIKGTKTFCYFTSSDQRMKFIAKNELSYSEIELSCISAKLVPSKDNPTFPQPLKTKYLR